MSADALFQLPRWGSWSRLVTQLTCRPRLGLQGLVPGGATLPDRVRGTMGGGARGLQKSRSFPR